MYILVAQIIFVGSFFGIGTILFRKIPFLTELSPEKNGESSLLKKLRDIKENKFSQSLSLKNLLQKILLKSKRATLKTENKIGFWLEKLEEEPKNRLKDNYWRDIKKSINSVKKETKKTKKSSNQKRTTKIIKEI